MIAQRASKHGWTAPLGGYEGHGGRAPGSGACHIQQQRQIIMAPRAARRTQASHYIGPAIQLRQAARIIKKKKKKKKANRGQTLLNRWHGVRVNWCWDVAFGQACLEGGTCCGGGLERALRDGMVG